MTLKEWPSWINGREPRPKTGRYTFVTWKFWNKDSPLLESGLIGPVLLKAAKVVPADSMSSLNPTVRILTIAEDVLAARIAEAKHDNQTALELFKKGVRDEDSLAYDEPPQWFHPVRESLGGFLLRSGNYAEAERVFRADLERNRHSGRSLYGLMETLKAQKKTQAAAVAQREFEQAWKNADTKLSVAEL